ncbi:MAG TPA: hypothetical protein VKU40_03635 [Thermoanaerobaculia bacterium]|nr:hypothetical protein [Thermoanaerobaculia bacterium]
MKRRPTHLRPQLFSVVLVVLAALVLAAPATADELYNYTLSAFAGFGGSHDAEPGDGFGNTGFQLGASVRTEARTRLALRVGSLGLGDGDEFGALADADLTYVTIAGEYRFTDPVYDSWIYMGLGAYDLDGSPRFPGLDTSDTTFGAVLGLAGEFSVTRRFDIVVELSGHWADFEDAQVFGMGHVGVAYHF